MIEFPKHIFPRKLLLFAILFGAFSLVSCGQEKTTNQQQSFEVQKSEKEWKAELKPKEYEVLRKEGTEPAFSGRYVDWDKKGIFKCKACGNPLFSSATKFKSGTGWPSFYDYLNEESILRKQDNSNGWNRVEIECQRCGSHIGHVFEDGPEPTGLRYCMNSLALDFEAK